MKLIRSLVAGAFAAAVLTGPTLVSKVTVTDTAVLVKFSVEYPTAAAQCGPFGDFCPPPPPEEPGAPNKPEEKSGSKKKKFKFSAKGYFVGSTICAASMEIIEATTTGNAKQRQLTLREAWANLIGCFTYGIGKPITLAVWKETRSELVHACVAHRYDQLAARRQRFFADVVGDRKSWAATYPPVQQMLAELKAAGVNMGRLMKHCSTVT